MTLWAGTTYVSGQVELSAPRLVSYINCLSLSADSRGRRADAKGSKPSTHTGTVRPASADTLDFDDDDDEDTEDVFERVRRKYNLQIDSDDDDISRL